MITKLFLSLVIQSELNKFYFLVAHFELFKLLFYIGF